MRPPALSVIAEGVDVTKRPELWPTVHRDYRGPGRLELVPAHGRRHALSCRAFRLLAVSVRGHAGVSPWPTDRLQVKRVLGIGGVTAVGVALLLASPANAQTLNPGGGTTAPAAATIHVPSDFDHALSGTRATGHYAVQGTALHIYTEGATSTDKVAEYVDTNTPLNEIGEPSLDYASKSGGAPGYQLVVDFNNDGTTDGTLVGEPTAYPGNDWWASNDSAPFVKAAAPSHDGGFGSANHGTLEQWRTAFPNATVKAFGFSLGSGVHGDGLINSITFNGTVYTFAADVVLTSKNECKNGGWATSTIPAYKNQGECVSHFAAGK
jgi:hypothetical protein